MKKQQLRVINGKTIVHYPNHSRLATLEYDAHWECWRINKLHGTPDYYWVKDLYKLMKRLDRASKWKQ